MSAFHGRMLEHYKKYLIVVVSFKSYIEKHRPATAVRFSTNEYVRNGSITNIPLYFAGKLFALAQSQ